MDLKNLKIKDYFLSMYRKLRNIEPKWRAIFVIYFALSIITANENFKAGAVPYPSWHEHFISFAGPAPNVYRVLPHFFAEAIHVVFGVSIPISYCLQHALFTFLAMCLFHIYLRKWFPTEIAMIGPLFTFAVLPLTYGWMGTQPYGPFNLLILIAGFMAIREGRDSYLIPILVIGTLNKATPLFLVLAYILNRYDKVSIKTLIANSTLYFTAWSAVYFGLRLIIGHRDYYCDFWMYKRNIQCILDIGGIFNSDCQWISEYSILIPLLLLSSFWILAFLDFRKKPRFLTRSAWIIPPFLILHFLIAIITDVRLLVPLFPIIIPLGLFTLFQADKTEAKLK